MSPPDPTRPGGGGGPCADMPLTGRYALRGTRLLRVAETKVREIGAIVFPEEEPVFDGSLTGIASVGDKLILKTQVNGFWELDPAVEPLTVVKREDLNQSLSGYYAIGNGGQWSSSRFLAANGTVVASVDPIAGDVRAASLDLRIDGGVVCGGLGAEVFDLHGEVLATGYFVEVLAECADGFTRLLSTNGRLEGEQWTRDRVAVVATSPERFDKARFTYFPGAQSPVVFKPTEAFSVSGGGGPWVSLGKLTTCGTDIETSLNFID